MRYARCDEDDGETDGACFKHPASKKLPSQLSWLHDTTMVTPVGSEAVPTNVLPDGHGRITVRGVVYDVRGRGGTTRQYNEACRLARKKGQRVCLLVHTLNWKVMQNTASKMSKVAVFNALWRASDAVLRGPQDCWIAKKNDSFLGYISFRSRAAPRCAKARVGQNGVPRHTGGQTIVQKFSSTQFLSKKKYKARPL